MTYSPNGKKISVFLLGAVLGTIVVGGMLSLNFSSRLTVLSEKLEDIASGQSRIVTELNAWRSESRRAALDARMTGAIAAVNPAAQVQSSRKTQPASMPDAQPMPAMDSEKTVDGEARAQAGAANSQEAESAPAIIAKLHDRSAAYPNLQTLMSSPEVAALAPEDLDKVAREVARMLNAGELDRSTFFPPR